jgi:hypothetical protein
MEQEERSIHDRMAGERLNRENNIKTGKGSREVGAEDQEWVRQQHRGVEEKMRRKKGKHTKGETSERK